MRPFWHILGFISEEKILHSPVQDYWLRFWNLWEGPSSLLSFWIAALYSFCVATITISEATTTINAAGYTEGITKAYAFSGILIATIITMIITTPVILLL